MINNLLDDIRIIDFSTRLPGPLASYILQNYGAHVTKVENKLYRDNFSLEESDDQFKQWYSNLNNNKEILVLDFDTDFKKIETLIYSSDLIIIPKNKFFTSFLKLLNLDQKSIIEIAGGSSNSEPLHDLNALAMTKSFKLHSETSNDPPYLPIAGMSFSQYIASTSIAMIRKMEKTGKAQRACLYLSVVTPLILDTLNVESNDGYKFLHNGLYPCYNLYKTKDNKTIALAAVEEKYWLKFINLFNLKLNSNDRFDKSGEIKGLVKKTFAKLNSHEICSILNNEHICLTINDN